MEKLTAKERLSISLYGSFDGALPTEDNEVFQLYAAVLLVKTIMNMMNMMGEYPQEQGADYSNFRTSDSGVRIMSYNDRVKSYIEEVEKSMVEYICEKNGFTGRKKEKSYLEWFRNMNAVYQQNAMEWAETIRKKALYLIPIFTVMVTLHDEKE